MCKWIIKSLRATVILLLLPFSWSTAFAQTNVFINIDTGRTEGLFTKSPVYQRAIMFPKPSPQSDTALLFFRGAPGIWRLSSAADLSKASPRGQIVRDVYAKANITNVIIDCPTDQWGSDRTPPSNTNFINCLEDYRSSKQHADDVRGVIKKLRDEHGITKFFIQGHSYGTVSSRWLAKNLGAEIAGSIHSAANNNPQFSNGGRSLVNFQYQDLASPQLHVHHENDACYGTPYAAVKAYAGQNLITVRGGLPTGDPCGSGHFHGFDGRDAVVTQAIADWILTGKVSPLVGE